MRRTLQGMVASVMRAFPGMSIPPGEIKQVLETANKDIHASHSWPWTYKDWNLAIPPPQTTGTITIYDGTYVVQGLGTTFPTLQPGYRLRFGDASIDYQVQAIFNATSLALTQPINRGADYVDVPYTLYKDTFEFPVDFEIGQDVILTNPLMRSRLKHIPRYTFEKQMMVLRPLQSNFPLYYTDNSFNPTSGCHSIRICPPLSTRAEYRLTYRAKPPDLDLPTSVTALPEGFDEVLELMAEARLKMIYQHPGAEAAAVLATGKLRSLKRIVGNATVEIQPTASGVPDSSYSQWGLSILPWSNP